MHDICQRQRVAIRLTSPSWTIALDSFAKMLQFFLGQADFAFTSNAANIKSAVECIETVRLDWSMQCPCVILYFV